MIKKGKKLKLTQYIQIYKNNDPLVMLLGSMTREITEETCPKVKLSANHQEN